MKKTTFRRRALAGSVFAGLFASTLAGSAIAQEPVTLDDAADDEEAVLDKVTITGSRLNTNPNLVAANPVLSVGAEEIDVRGNVRIEDLTNILPQVFAGQAGEVSNGASGTATLNLRGLGANRTLVLIDGRRLPFGASGISAANLDLIPTQLVERVDILTGGASAVYGSDAVGGVANFILKSDFEGFELDIQGGLAQNGNNIDLFENVLAAGSQPIPGGVTDGEELFISAIIGANTPDGRGNATLFASYETREAILQSDRVVSACALGADTGAQSFGGFGCVGSANFRLFGGSQFAFQQENGDINAFAGGPAETFNFGPFNFFQRPSERFQIYARGHYDLTDNIQAFADLSFTNNSSDAQIAPTASFGIGAYSINCDNPFLVGNTGTLDLATDVFGCTSDQVANGDIITGITASHRNVEGGPRNSNLDNTAWRLVGGFRGTFAENWDYEIFGQFARTQDTSISTNDFVVANLQQAFLVRDNGNGPECIDPSGGCVPYNIFQRGPNGESLVSQEALDFIQGVGIVVGETEQIVVGANVQTDLGNYGISSPLSEAGVGFLLGVEYRDDDLDANPDQISQVQGGGFTGVGGATLPVEGSIDVFEIYTEVQIPIVTDAPFAEELTFSGQYRYSDYSTDGNGIQNNFDTNAFGLQLTYAPIEDIKFRGQFQRAVRAPNVIELFTGVNTGLPNLNSAGTNANGVQLFDPCASDAPIATLAACMNTGVTAAQFGTILDVISGQTQSITGGNPLLEPESSDTFTVGAVITPSAVPGLSITVDYFDIVVEDFIAAGVPAQTSLDNCLATGDPTFCDLITRAPSGTLAAGTFGVGFTQTNLNIAELSTSGIDFQVVYSFDLADLGLGDFGTVNTDYAATWLNEFDFIPFPGGDAVECAGFFGNQCSPVNPSYRHRWLTTWSTPWDLTVATTWRFFSGTDNIAAATAPDIDQAIEAQNYFDLNLTYNLNDNVSFRSGVLNVFNNQPPVSVSSGPPLGNGNTFPTIFDTGRFFFLGVNIRL
ncbi:MAG: TonB-dependent receptor [Pseudomonadota bacterium]